MTLHPGHFVAIFGGACAGSEAARQLAQRGIYVAVFDQQALPYGKIEDGLPKWHVKLRDKEEGKIDEKLSHSNIFYIPTTKLGKDIQFEDVVHNWGFSAVLLANGAWRDRPLPIEGVDEYLEKGLYYQNPFVDWFNHYHEPEYNRYQYHVKDGAIVVGGGLASIDVVKILMLETTADALEKLGFKTDILTLEHKGIPKVLERFGLSFSELGIQGCTLYYRRRDIDMPLASLPPDASPEKVAKTQQIRQRILQNAQKKYLFRFQDRSKPVGMIIDNNHVSGLKFERTEIIDGRVKSIPNSEFEIQSPLLISSIGSIPERIPGIPTKGELFDIADEDTGKLDDYPHVFALGNAVTGRGNIRESELHSKKVVQHVMDNFLNWHAEDFEALNRNGKFSDQIISEKNLLREENIEAILKRIEEQQRKAGYTRDYNQWVSQHRPIRLEEIIAESDDE